VTLRALACLALAALVLAGCGTPRKGGVPAAGGGGGYYKDDGPGANPPPDIDDLPDAVPRIEPLASGANRPYVVFGERYVPVTSGPRYRQRGIASWYGRKFHGAKTSNGETYDMYAMTAAHPTLPIPSYARVTRVATGRSVVVRINDRGPFHSNRIIDLSYAAARKLGLIGPGRGEVIVEQILPEDIERSARAEPAQPAAAAAAPALPVSASLAGSDSAAPGAPPGPSALSAPAPSHPTPAPAASAAPLPAMSAGSGGTAWPLLPTVPPGAAPADAGGPVFLQAGAFSQADNARTLARRLQTVLADSAPGVQVEQGGSLYRVKIGPYADRDAALGAAREIGARTGILPAIALP